MIVDPTRRRRTSRKTMGMRMIQQRFMFCLQHNLNINSMAYMLSRISWECERSTERA